MTPEKRAIAGAELLDKHMPNWRQNVDPHSFRIKSIHYCVLGQQPHGYEINLSYLARLKRICREDLAIDFGFDIPPFVQCHAEGYDKKSDYIGELEAAWRRILHGS
jgi:hypothetical protein